MSLHPRQSIRLWERRDTAFYRNLWEQAEADRKAADADVRQTATLLLEILELLGVDDHPDPELRGKVRMLRSRVTYRCSDCGEPLAIVATQALDGEGRLHKDVGPAYHCGCTTAPER